MRTLLRAAALAGVLACGHPCQAELNSADWEAASKMIAGTFYLRIDLPCRYFYGSYPAVSLVQSMIQQVEPLVEVSPAEFRAHSAAPEYLSEDVQWWFGPNSGMRYSKLRENGAALDIDMEGLPPNNKQVFVRFVGVRTLQDFKAAFDRAFSRVPLQDEHPEWPAEIRTAIAERRVIAGMTPEQVYCVFGQPVKEEKSEANGGKVVTWYPRQAIIHSTKPGGVVATNFPASLKFVDGKLAAIGEPSKPGPLAKFPKKMLEQANLMLRKKLYLRTDLPYLKYPRFDAMTEVSPEGVRMPNALPAFRSASIVWKLRPNDKVLSSDVKQSGGALEVQGTGVHDIVVLFVGIKSMDDFKAAFKRTFSEVPLQDEHPDWPEEVRSAIAKRRVMQGMTPEQVYCVTGGPMRVESLEENGAKVEVWHPRDEVRVARDKAAADSPGSVTSLRFVGGKLVVGAQPSSR